MSHSGFFQAGTGPAMKLTPGSKGFAGRCRESRRVFTRKGIGGPSTRYVAGPHGDGVGDDFRERMIAFLPRLSGFAYALTGNADQRDDLVQETCVRVLSANRDKWQPGARLDSWMFRIAQNPVAQPEVQSRRVRGEVGRRRSTVRHVRRQRRSRSYGKSACRAARSATRASSNSRRNIAS